MALVRVASRNLQQKVSSAPLMGHNYVGERSLGGLQRQRTANELLKRFMATASDEKQDSKEVAVSDRKSSRQVFPRRRGRRGLWRSADPDFVPALYEFFPSGLGNALLQATQNINRLFENLHLSPSLLAGRVKEQDECYVLRYEMPGLGKEDVKVTVDDGWLSIKGEQKEEKGDGPNDEYWSSSRIYDYCLALPDDAKVDEIKAELKDGVLSVTIPRTEKPKKDVKEIKVV